MQISEFKAGAKAYFGNLGKQQTNRKNKRVSHIFLCGALVVFFAVDYNKSYYILLYKMMITGKIGKRKTGR